MGEKIFRQSLRLPRDSYDMLPNRNREYINFFDSSDTNVHWAGRGHNDRDGNDKKRNDKRVFKNS